MKKLLTLFTLLLTVCSGAWGTDVTVGRSVAFNNSATDFSLTNVTNTTCTKADGTGNTKTSNDTQTVWHNGSSVSMKGNLCYANKIGSTNVNNSSNFNDNLYCGFNLSIADGYELTVTNLTTKIATSANVFYNIKVIDLDNDNAVLYGGEASNITVTNYNDKNNYTNFDHTFTPASELVLSGNVQVRLYWNQNSTGKYICPLEIFINGSLESAVPDSRVDPGLSYGASIVNKVIGDAAFINTLTNENGVTITYSISNNGTGSTIDENTGEVTIGSNQGTETITATSTATSTYKSGKATYTLNVGMSAVSNKFWDFSDWTVADITSTTTKDNLELVATSDKIMQILSNNAQEVGDESFTKRLKLNGTGNASYRYVHFKVAPKSQIYVYQFSGNADRKLKVYAGSFNGTKLLEEGTTEYKKSICAYTGNEETDIYVYSGADNISIYGIKVEPMKQVTISDKKYATFASDYDLDFSGVDGLYAYTATVAGDIITFNKVTKAKAGEGLLLYSETAKTYNVPVATNSPAFVPGNKLVRGTGAAVTSAGDNSGEYNYVLSTNDKGEVNFYLAAGKEVGTNKAYLKNIPTTTPSKFFLPTGDEEGEETDGIKSVQGSRLTVNGEAYNLAGQKVGADYKGIVIVNGKKVIRK